MFISFEKKMLCKLKFTHTRYNQTKKQLIYKFKEYVTDSCRTDDS